MIKYNILVKVWIQTLVSLEIIQYNIALRLKRLRDSRTENRVMWKKESFHRALWNPVKNYVHLYCFHKNWEDKKQPAATNQRDLTDWSSTSMSTPMKTDVLAVCWFQAFRCVCVWDSTCFSYHVNVDVNDRATCLEGWPGGSLFVLKRTWQHSLGC